MYRASDRVANEDWIERLTDAGETLGLDDDAVSTATDLFLTHAPDADREKSTIAAASLYAAALIRGQERSQIDVAEAMDVTRLSVQQHWKPILEEAGFQPPSW